MPSTAAVLARIEVRLTSIEAAISARGTVAQFSDQFRDVEETYGFIAQFRELYEAQRDSLAALVIIANVLLGEGRAHDTRSVSERETIQALLLQLRELGRKHVAGLYDIERAVSGGLTEDERARSASEGD